MDTTKESKLTHSLYNIGNSEASETSLTKNSLVNSEYPSDQESCTEFTCYFLYDNWYREFTFYFFIVQPY